MRMGKEAFETFLPPHGNYEEKLSYRKGEIIYDVTFRFCGRFLYKGNRTIGQMEQAARFPATPTNRSAQEKYTRHRLLPVSPTAGSPPA